MMRGLMVAVSLLALAGCIDLPDSARATDGARTFQANCAGCHGADGTGGGTMFGPAPSLTGLAARQGGTFPAQAVLDVLEGHGRNPDFSAAMPEFGGQGMGSGPFVSVAGVEGPVPVRTAALLAYLETIQK